jgi:hypothetical protein
MESAKRIALNFLPLQDQSFRFAVFRTPYLPGATKDEVPANWLRFRLPTSPASLDTDAVYGDYWVSLTGHAEMEEFECEPGTNHRLTNVLLHHLLSRSCETNLDSNHYFIDPRYKFRRYRIFFVLRTHREGKEIVWLEPYYLKSVRSFGFLIDFEFQESGEVQNSRRVQQLSLSLDENFRSNRNFYSDRYTKLREFVSKFHSALFPLKLHDLQLPVLATFQALQSQQLQQKRYIVGKDHVANSQFAGVRNSGPLQQAASDMKVFFLFQQEDRTLSRDLYRALRGETFASFPGMERMFGFRLSSENVVGVPMRDFSAKSITSAIGEMKKQAAIDRIVPLAIVPFASAGDETDDHRYHIAKHAFLEAGLPSQFVTRDLLKNKATFKWAVSNIGLQLFAKLGGQPWKVQPHHSECLIVGLSQSHLRKEDRVEKYFAYSILTEATGLYKDLQVLSSSADFGSYIESFRQNLHALIRQYWEKYEKFVVHATFSIQGQELEATQDVLRSLQSSEGGGKTFVAMKFNDRSSYFGFAVAHNSLVPYESSYVRLSGSEYLVWFEGLQYHTPSIQKRIGRPMHVEFLFPREGLEPGEMRSYLQDAVNLSGANWRGFNAKSAPVSIYYAWLVARYVRQFQALHLGDINLDVPQPWFL